MFSQKDILNTLDMIDKRHLDIRTITMGISLLDCCDTDLDRCCEKIYKKITTCAKDLVKVGCDIEKEFDITRSTASKVIDLMEQKGLIERQKVSSDARLKKISLTPKAEQLSALFEKDQKNLEETLTKGFTAEELQTLNEYIIRMKTNLGTQGDKQ